MQQTEGQRSHQRAERALGTTRVTAREAGSAESARANRAWWNADAEDYHAEHGAFLGALDPQHPDFVWCPEGLREADLGLLGTVAGASILELGCGSAPCSRWLAARGAHAVGLDVAEGMLAFARATDERLPLVQGTAEALPFGDGVFDHACSAFGAIPFVASLDAVLAEVTRVLREGGRFVFAVNHPMRWAFPDVGGPEGLTVQQSYFDRTPYVEIDDTGAATYVEHHRTVGDYVVAIHQAGLVLRQMLEPEWPEHLTRHWGQWSPLRGRLFPGTAIFCTAKP